MMSLKNIFYAQSGGATAVINASAFGVISSARKHCGQIGKVYAGKNGILGALNEELIDTSLMSDSEVQALLHTPSSAFGSCRYKLRDQEQDDSEYRRLIEVFEAHNIGYFFYNGGGDSQDTAFKVSQISHNMGYPITCIGIPKTIDNDLAFTDCCPGFGSVAKYIAVSTQEVALDVACMSATSTKIFILEVMGRHAGWIAAASGLGKKSDAGAPHIILFPEIAFDKENFLQATQQAVENHGYCVIVASEGICDTEGKFVSQARSSDAFGHSQLGGVAPHLAEMIQQRHGYKYHWAVADYLQRAARHIASQTDLDQAAALGSAAVEYALAGENNVMLTIERLSDAPYRWRIGTAPLCEVANVEKPMPKSFISACGYEITDECRTYLSPLIEGEAYPPYKNGIPDYLELDLNTIEKKLSKVEAE
jgi:ATP-dependent phosphofructokinase / diphosphate-dependent phosphofructokinase